MGDNVNRRWETENQRHIGQSEQKIVGSNVLLPPLDALRIVQRS